jgi:CBS domain-containing protein
MTTIAASPQRLRRVFTENFSAADIAEPLASFDASTPAAEVLAVMTRRAYRVAGIRTEGTISGYVRQEDLTQGVGAAVVHPFEDGDVVPDSAAIPELVMRLNDRPWLFVNVLGQVGGIVTRTDLLKPPVRMWLFGMITIIEMGLTRLIESAYPDGSWRQHLSEGRLQKAEALLEERRRRKQDLGLLDCLQFSDRGLLVLRNEELRKRAGFVSRSRGEQTVKDLEALRNNLAHSQDIVACDWDIIVKLIEHLDIFFGPTR